MLFKNTLVLLLCVVVSLMLITCGDTSTTGPTEPPPPPPEGYYPMQIGSVWQYSLSGTETNSSGNWDLSGTEIWTIAGQSVHDEGFNVYQLNVDWSTTYTPTGGGTSYTTSDSYTDWVYVDDNVVRLYDYLSATTYSQWLQFPLSVGNTWNYWPDLPGIAIITVESMSASVTVPAGTFDGCAHLSFDYGQAPNDYLNRYFAEGTGLIKQVYHVDSGTTDIFTYEIKLTSYNQ